MSFQRSVLLLLSVLLVASAQDAYGLQTPLAAPKAYNPSVPVVAPKPSLSPPVKSYTPPPKLPMAPYPPKASSPPVAVKPPVVAPYPPKTSSPPVVVQPPVTGYPPKAPAPVTAKPPPSPLPYYGSLPPVKGQDCEPLCEKRCALHSRQQVCVRACSTCCERCKCVPPGTYGNKELCGSCYTEMTTHGGKLKCP